MNIKRPLIIIFLSIALLVVILVNITDHDLFVMSEVNSANRKELKNLVVKSERFTKSGFNFYTDKRSPALLLLSRYDNDLEQNVIELIDLVEGSEIHNWIFPDLSVFHFDSQNKFQTYPNKLNLASSKMIHPLLNQDGSLVFNFYQRSPLFSVDSCGKLLWKNLSYAFHHSLEKDSEGNYWSAGFLDKAHPVYGQGFIDDKIVKVSPEGKTLFSKSVLEILIENNLQNKIYTYDKFIDDPIHLNDIQPVLEDGKFWREGDLFLSVSHLNLILLYRPSMNKLIWWNQDIMMHQHDIDIISPDKISVFNNNRITTATGDIVVGTNEVLIFDFSQNSFSSPYKELFQKENIITVNQGLSDIGKNGELFVEETAAGRLIFFSPEGNKEWEYINKDSKGKTFVLNWSRIIPYSMKDSLMAHFSNCK